MATEQKRIFLWAVPRSISTAFMRAMMHRSNTKVFLEPYSRAFYTGPERGSTRYQDEPVNEEFTYDAINKEIEQELPEYDTIFVKDMAYYLAGRLDAVENLPKNYIHTFLLRNPEKSVYSLYKMSLNTQLTGWDRFDPCEVGFKELFELYKLVTDKLGQQAIVIDADDLLKDPEGMLKLYCSKVGIEYEDSMINWETQPKDLTIFKEWMPWFEGVLTSTSFKPSDTKPRTPVAVPDLPRHVQACITDSMGYYNQMHSKRITTNKLH